MFRSIRTMCAASVGTLLAIGTAIAGEVQPAHISQNAAWFAHLDFEAGADSKIFETLTSEGNSRQPSRLGGWLANRYGIDMQALDGLTMYATDADEASTISLLYGDLHESKLIDTVKQQANVSSREVGNVTFHTWKIKRDKKASGESTKANSKNRSQFASDRDLRQPNKASDSRAYKTGQAKPEIFVTAAFLDNVAVFANGFDHAEKAVTSIQNKQGFSLKDDLRLSQNVQGKILVQAVALDVGKANPTAQAGQGDAQGDSVAAQSWAILGNVDTISVAIGEMDESDEAFVAVEAKAKSEQSARQVGDLLDGLRALAALSDADGEFDLGAAKPDVEQEGAFLRIGWTLNVERVAGIIDRKLEQSTMTAGARDEPTAVNR